MGGSTAGQGEARAGEGRKPALSSTLRAVGCQVTMPTRLVCPSNTTTGSVSGETNPFSGICHTCGRGEAASEGLWLGLASDSLEPTPATQDPPRPHTSP